MFFYYVTLIITKNFKPHGNHKSKIGKRYTHKKQKAIQTTLNIALKSQENHREKEERKDLQKQIKQSHLPMQQKESSA